MGRVASKNWLAAAIVALSALWESGPALRADIISADRRVAWSPGIPGGIPAPYPVGPNVQNAPYLAKGDGVADDTAAIQAAIMDCPSGKAVYLPPGTYRTTRELDISGKSIVLRGAGPNSTKIIDYSTLGTDSIIMIVGQSNTAQANVTGGYTKDSTAITVDSAANFSTGDYVIIDQDNDPSVCINMDSWAIRPLGQIVQITGKAGNQLQLARPLYYTFSPTFNIHATRFNNPAGFTKNCGVEDLYVERVNPNQVSNWANNISLNHVVNCWVKNVESYKTSVWHILVYESLGCEVRQCYMHHAQAYTSGRGYGVLLFDRATDNLVEDNVLYYLRHSLVVAWGGAGNVFGYNYSHRLFDDNYPLTSWLMIDALTHGNLPFMNLYEGNIVTHMGCDNAHGSGQQITFFRNHSEAYSVGEGKAIGYSLNGAEIQMNQLYINVVGNILRRPGDTGDVWKIGCNQSDCSTIDTRVAATLLMHGNFDYVSGQTQWDPTIADHALPNSLYLTAKPAFFGNLPWPCIGPDLNPMVGILPAKLRWDQQYSGAAAESGLQ